MKTIATLCSMLMLTGCATPPRVLEIWFDGLDPCQSKGRANYQYPDFCGAGTATAGTVIRDRAGQPQGTLSK